MGIPLKEWGGQIKDPIDCLGDTFYHRANFVSVLVDEPTCLVAILRWVHYYGVGNDLAVSEAQGGVSSFLFATSGQLSCVTMIGTGWDHLLKNDLRRVHPPNHWAAMPWLSSILQVWEDSDMHTIKCRYKYRVQQGRDMIVTRLLCSPTAGRR